MKKLAATIALLSLCTSHAYAADLPSRASPPVFVPPPITGWGGCYGGVFGAYDIAKVRTTRTETDTTTTTIPPRVVDDGVAVVTIPGATRTTTAPTTSSSYGRTDSGGDGGARLGCNYQTGNFVIGGQIEGGYLGISGTAVDPTRPTTYSSLSGGPYGAVSGKLGLAVGEKALLFVRGGVGYADLHFKTMDGTLNYTTGTTGSQVMPLVGAGVEYKLTDNVSVTGEYTYLRPGCRTSNYAVSTTTDRGSNGFDSTTGVGSATSCVDKHMVSIGLNYYFNAPVVPVVARY